MGNMVPIDIPAGVVNELAKSRRSSNWRETHLVRWDGNTVLPIGGWVQLAVGPFASKVRVIHKWMANNGIIYIAYLCERHVYVEANGALTDITPVGGIAEMPNNIGGYGDFKFGKLSYGTPRPGGDRGRRYAETWSIDNWGDQLRVMTSYDGRLLGWDPMVPATKLVAVTNAPVANRSFVITPERHIILFGMGGKVDQFGWCDQEDDTNWDFTDITSRAGFYDIEPSSPIVAHQLFFGGIYMATMANNYLIRWVGLPYVYNFDQVADAPVPLSPLSIQRTPEGCVWAALGGFWMFNGSATVPLPVLIYDWIKKLIDTPASIDNAYMGVVENKNELWWFFTSKDDATKNQYVAIYNYREKWWTMGKVSRTCAITYGNEMNPLMSDGTYIYRHEDGFNYTPEALPWAETFTINASAGNNLSTFHQMRPDVPRGRDALRFSLKKAMDMSKPEVETQSPHRSLFGDGLVDFRETAREFRLRIDMVANDDWSIGPMLVDIRRRGQK